MNKRSKSTTGKDKNIAQNLGNNANNNQESTNGKDKNTAYFF